MPTHNDIDRAHRKAKVLLSIFWTQIQDFRNGKADYPQIRVDTHPDLPNEMNTEWMARMEVWKDAAIQEILLKLGNTDVDFQVTRIGGVQAELEINNKFTRVVLYMPDKTRAREWLIVMEPLAYWPDAEW